MVRGRSRHCRSSAFFRSDLNKTFRTRSTRSHPRLPVCRRPERFIARSPHAVSERSQIASGFDFSGCNLLQKPIVQTIGVTQGRSLGEGWGTKPSRKSVCFHECNNQTLLSAYYNRCVSKNTYIHHYRADMEKTNNCDHCRRS